jgi:hypothetical protein
MEMPRAEAGVDPVTAALVGWLVGRVADTGARKLDQLLRGDKQANALRAVVAEAVQGAVDEVVAPGDRAVVRDALRREGPDSRGIDVRDVLALREAVLRVVEPRVSVLADQGFRADADCLADAIAQRIEDGIQFDAARGGPLAPVADLLRHEELAGTGSRIADAAEETVRVLKEMQATRGAPSAQVPTRPVRLAPRPASLAGREQLLAELQERLSRGDSIGPRVVALYGLGGAGKTSVALEHAHAHVDEYGVVWQFAAEDGAALSAGFAELGRQLLGQDLFAAADQVAQVHKILTSRPDDWLLVFDNAASHAALRDFLPPTGHGHVIVTSQNPHWPTGQAVKVPELGVDVAAEFLVNRAGADESAARELAEELGGLPLALEQAAAYMEVTGLSLAAYLGRFREQRAALLARGEPLGYDKRVATTWTLAFEQVQRTAAEAISLLRLLSCCAPDAIPLNLLFHKGPGVLESVSPEPAQALRPLLADPIALDDAVVALRRYSLISPVVLGVVSVHRLVQAVTVDQLSAESRATWRQATGCVIEAALPNDPDLPGNWPTYAALLPHARATVDFHRPSMSKIAAYLGHSGNYAGARAFTQEILAARKGALGAKHPDTLEARRSLAAWTGHSGDAAWAQHELAELLPIYEQVYGPEHRQTLITRINLAYYSGHAGDRIRARDQLAELVPILERILGPDDAETLSTRAYLARWTGEAGDPAAARDQYERLLPDIEHARGPEDPEALTARVHLARFIGEAGNPARARDLFADLVSIREWVSGAEHPNTLIAKTYLARFIGETGNPALARDQLTEQVPIYEQVSGPEHPLTLTARMYLARFIGEAGNPARARDLFAELVPIRERVSGPEHPETQLARANLARWMQDDRASN